MHRVKRKAFLGFKRREMEKDKPRKPKEALYEDCYGDQNQCEINGRAHGHRPGQDAVDPILALKYDDAVVNATATPAPEVTHSAQLHTSDSQSNLSGYTSGPSGAQETVTFATVQCESPVNEVKPDIPDRDVEDTLEELINNRQDDVLALREGFSVDGGKSKREKKKQKQKTASARSIGKDDSVAAQNVEPSADYKLRNHHAPQGELEEVGQLTHTLKRASARRQGVVPIGGDLCKPTATGMVKVRGRVEDVILFSSVPCKETGLSLWFRVLKPFFTVAKRAALNDNGRIPEYVSVQPIADQFVTVFGKRVYKHKTKATMVNLMESAGYSSIRYVKIFTQLVDDLLATDRPRGTSAFSADGKSMLSLNLFLERVATNLPSWKDYAADSEQIANDSVSYVYQLRVLVSLLFLSNSPAGGKFKVNFQ